MDIREFKFDEDDVDSGIQAISFVTDPAIEQDFIFFSKEEFVTIGDLGPGIDGPEKPLSPKEQKKLTDTQKLINSDGYGWNFWEYITVNNEKSLLDNSHEFCVKHVNQVFHITEIRNWSRTLTVKEKEGWIAESNFTKNFKGILETDFNLHQQLYNCRHFLSPVRNASKVPPAKLNRNWGFFNEQKKQKKFSIEFSITSDEKHEIKGVAMIPEMLIYRVDGEGRGYHGYFTKSTVQKLKERYGYNKEITIQHEENITGNAILLDSWIFDKDNTDNCGVENLKDGSWCLQYKILNDNLWKIIKQKGVKGFSVEVLLPIV